LIRAAVNLAAFLLLSATTAQAVTCQNITFEATSFTACEIQADEDLRLFLRDAGGTVLGGFNALAGSLEDQTLSFATNAGMYHNDRRPVGLYIEDGQQIAAPSDGGGFGNFGLLPNGIFCINDRFRVWESAAYATSKPTCDHATQSGPMLVIDGALHPRFLPDSTSRRIRNGVGSAPDGSHAVFVISNSSVTFHQFARVFRDHLGLPNALFLDGSISRLHAPDLNRSDSGFSLGPMFGVVEQGG